MSVCRILLLQQKPKLGPTKTLTEQYAGRGLDIAGIDSHRRVDGGVIVGNCKMNHLLFAVK